MYIYSVNLYSDHTYIPIIISKSSSFYGINKLSESMDNLHVRLTFDPGKIFIRKSILMKRAY